MVSSFSNPGFPHVHAHPTRLPAMDASLSAAIDSFEASMRAALRDAIREALDSAFVNFTTNFSRDWALLRRDSTLRAEGVSDPVPTISDDTQSIDLSHPGLQGDDIPPRLPSPIEVHSVPPLFSSSPLLREIAAPSVKPQLNSNASMAAHTNIAHHFRATRKLQQVCRVLGSTTGKAAYSEFSVRNESNFLDSLSTMIHSLGSPERSNFLPTSALPRPKRSKLPQLI
ncbi:hypothetical protein ACFX2I_039660 [Malus domestica]